MGTDDKKIKARDKIAQAYELIVEATDMDPEIVVVMTAMAHENARFLVTKGNDYVVLGVLDEVHGIVENKLVSAYLRGQLQQQVRETRIVKPGLVPLNGGRKS